MNDVTALRAAAPPAPLTIAGRRSDTVRSDLRGHCRRWFWRRVLRAFTALHLAVLRTMQMILPRPRPIPAGRPLDILLTGTFHSQNWISAHVRPLAASELCGRVRLVSSSPYPSSPKVECIVPPAWLRRTIGNVPARLATFIWLAMFTRPDVVGGFHLLLNGLLAAAVARVSRAHSLYFCVGGPWEVLDGGIRAENRLFARLERSDPVIQDRLLRITQHFDLVITMGTRAAAFLREHGVRSAIEVVPGGFDAPRVELGLTPATVDVIFVGRLAAIKRVDVLLRAIAAGRRRIPSLSAVIVGDGPERGRLEALAGELGLHDAVKFVGQQPDVLPWLLRARLFVLTSDSEGLSLALIEAMACGLPAVVSDVGDLGDLVRNGVNGFLVSQRSPEEFAARMVEVLADPAKHANLSAEARAAAARLGTAAVGQRWSAILAGAMRHAG